MANNKLNVISTLTAVGGYPNTRDKITLSSIEVHKTDKKNSFQEAAWCIEISLGDEIITLDGGKLKEAIERTMGADVFMDVQSRRYRRSYSYHGEDLEDR